ILKKNFKVFERNQGEMLRACCLFNGHKEHPLIGKDLLYMATIQWLNGSIRNYVSCLRNE
ncbi:hypothetical protein IAG15_14960, partial [Enterococcus faecalis]|nr:hypothetical protein [Enterococcus faecalis]